MTRLLPAAVPSARWIAPRVGLASCVRGYFTRSTLDCPLLSEVERCNRFPAHPYCSITWFMQCQPRLTAPLNHPRVGQRMPRVTFSGPGTTPLVVQHDAPMDGFTVLIFPHALHALTRLDISAHTDCFSPLHEVFDGAWLDMAEAVLGAANDEARVALIEGFLDERWHAARRDGVIGSSVASDWVRVLASHAAAASLGQSARSLERRVRARAGQPLRTLRRLGRTEQAFLEARGQLATGRPSWAALAASGGYADQAHLCREVRDVTGETPAQLTRKLGEDESYWFFRIWS